MIFFQTGNGDAQVAAADMAIKNDPNDALLYYLKGQGLIQKATFDAKTQRIVLPEGCADAYQKYLELAPTGPYAGEVQGILAQAGQKVSSSYKAGQEVNRISVLLSRAFPVAGSALHLLQRFELSGWMALQGTDDPTTIHCMSAGLLSYKRSCGVWWTNLPARPRSCAAPSSVWIWRTRRAGCWPER